MKKSILMGCLVASVVFAAKVNAVDTKVSGVVFANYEAVISKYLESGDTANYFNSFDIGKVSLNGEVKFTEKVAGFIQYEGNLISREETKNSIYLKSALLTIKDIYPNAKIMFGLIPHPWRGYEEGIWKHRFVAKVLDDIEGFVSSTDRGIRLTGKASIVEYDLSILNGEGTKSNEINKYKDIASKIAIAPFKAEQIKGFKLNLYYSKGQFADGEKQERDIFIGGVSYESKKFNAMASYYNKKTKGVEGFGFSIHGVYNLTDKYWIFARYDNYDPNKDKPDDARSRIYLGYGYKITDGVRITLDYYSKINEKEAEKTKNISIVSSHLEMKF